MYELKYKITSDDIKAVNKDTALFYFLLYGVVAVVGIAVGAIAVALSSQTMMYVLGIILIVLGAMLGVCAVMLMIAPKNFVKSAVKISDAQLTVNVDSYGIRVTSDELKLMIRYSDITKVKDKKKYLLVYVGKDSVFIIKNAIRTGLTLGVLAEYIKTRTDEAVDPAALQAIREKAEQDAKNDATEGGEEQPVEDDVVEDVAEENKSAEEQHAETQEEENN